MAELRHAVERVVWLWVYPIGFGEDDRMRRMGRIHHHWPELYQALEGLVRAHYEDRGTLEMIRREGGGEVTELQHAAKRVVETCTLPTDFGSDRIRRMGRMHRIWRHWPEMFQMLNSLVRAFHEEERPKE